MNAPTTTTAVRISGVTKSFGRQRAVDAVDLEAGAGVVGILGPNGAGKSTLLRMAATVLAPDTGDLRLLGLDPEHPGERTAIRRRLGYLPQSPGLYGGFTAAEFVDYVAVLKEHTDRDWRREETARVLAAVGLADVAEKKIRRLSGGMKQRVALASTLIGHPDLLVLDEPANGLDPDQRLQLRAVIADVATVLLSTHNISEVEALCHRVVVMLEGRIAFAGTPSELAAHARGRVWEDERADPCALRSWQTGVGRFRHVGDPPPGAEVVDPTLDDGYLLLAREVHQ